MLDTRLPDTSVRASTATHGAAVLWRTIFLITCELHHRTVLPDTLLGVLGLGIFCWPIMMSGPPRSVLLRLSTEKRILMWTRQQPTYATGTVGVFRHQNNNVRGGVFVTFLTTDVISMLNRYMDFVHSIYKRNHQAYPLFGSVTPSDAENNFRGHAALFRFCPHGFLQKHNFLLFRSGTGSSDSAWKLAINASSEHQWSVPAGTKKTWLHVFDFEQWPKHSQKSWCSSAIWNMRKERFQWDP